MSRSEEQDSRFTVVSDVETNRRERYQQMLEKSILVPLRLLLDDWRGKLGTTIVAIYIIGGIVGPRIVAVPSQNQAPRFARPFQNTEYILGADNLGRSLLSQLIYGTPVVLKMILAGAVFTTIVATIVGTTAGYKGGRIDSLLTTILDIILTIPGLPLVIVLAVIFQPRNPFVIGILLSVNTWAGLGRSIRSQVLTVREEPYVEASRTMGVSLPRILKDDILPNIMSYVLINFVLAGRRVIFSSVALYYLGVLPPVGSHWGVILNVAYSSGALYTTGLQYWIIFPILTIVLLSYGMFLLSQAADRIFNVRLRAESKDGPENDY